jgi:uncharacterized small protein (DUF1192 family)
MILNGWKEIAGYLRRGIRTVQRWELLGLPVHRVGSGPRAGVIGYSDELDQWGKSAPVQLLDVITDLNIEVAALKEKIASLQAELRREKRKPKAGTTAPQRKY